jgi:hypothetical protein
MLKSKRSLRKGGVSVTTLAYGGGPLGDMYASPDGDAALERQKQHTTGALRFRYRPILRPIYYPLWLPASCSHTGQSLGTLVNMRAWTASNTPSAKGLTNTSPVGCATLAVMASACAGGKR